MKKEYTKPNMEIVSFNTAENITAESTSAKINTTAGYQADFKTISY
ncbi:MAG: hypothetical protein LUC92_07715 [Clostridiales bacterium]|nr:hypothetical protein [Clostridiales bacterium]